MEVKILERTFVDDTSFVLAIVSEKDELHQKAKDLVKIYGMYPWLTTDLVLYEVANSLARNAKTQAQKIINDFLEADGIEIVYASPALFRKGFALYCKLCRRANDTKENRREGQKSYHARHPTEVCCISNRISHKGQRRCFADSTSF